MRKIVIVGGGAGGLELATKLGRKLGRKNKAAISLVDRNRTHLWKPLLHEVAAGSIDTGIDSLSYRAHGTNNGFQFQLGDLVALDRENKTITLGAMLDDEGQEVLRPREIDFDILVFAIGSQSNDFGTPGVSDFCFYIDSQEQAQRFHYKLLNKLLQLGEMQRDQVRVAIVGAGATGVELTAELFNALKQMKSYGYSNIMESSLKVALVEAGPAVLPALPERISSAVHEELEKLGAHVSTETRITSASENILHTHNGKDIEADLMVWAAGIKVADFLAHIGGLETSQINQLVVKPTLKTTKDPAIYAIGDCASYTQDDGVKVPPRAQAAHQMASLVYKNILSDIYDKPLKNYTYKDYGSLVSLSKYSTVGSLMGGLMQGSLRVEGRIARIVYVSLYRMHQVALHGVLKTAVISIVGSINRVLRPRLKLH